MFVTPMFSAHAGADGFSSRYNSMLETWNALAERDQFCIINYHDGTEKMVIKIQLDGPELRSSDKVAWLFPVPGDPESVTLRHFQITPIFYGDSLGSAALDRVADSTSWGLAFGTQFYTAPAILTAYMVQGYGGSGMASDSVEVSGVLEQYGVTSEVLTAHTSGALNDYLISKGLTLPDMAGTAIRNYLYGGYSIVLSWISNVSAFLTEALRVPGIDAYSIGIGVEFPSDDIFFPLKMTSAYGELEIPITVQIVDHVTPRVYPSSGNLNFSCRYNVQESYSRVPIDSYRVNLTEYQEGYEYFFAEQIAENDGKTYFKSIDYTVVTFDGSAAALSEDLWLSDSEPLTVSTVGFVYDNPWLVVLALLILVSCVSSLIACTIIFGWNPRLAPTYALLGLANLLTIGGYYLGYVMLKPKLEKKSVNVERRGWKLMLLFSGFFVYLLGSIYFVFFYGPTVGV